MAQATGIQALSRAGQRLGEPVYLETARQALKLFSLAAAGRRAPDDAVGARYLLYSFAPGQIVVNASVQTLVALHDYAEIASKRRRWRLFRAGDRQARLDVRAGDTGAWSLYQLGGAESDLSYHELLTGFLHNLCDRTETELYCATAAAFTRDLKQPPTMELLTRRLRARRYALVRFELSKVSRVGMTIRRDGNDVLSTSASVSRGAHSLWLDRPGDAGHVRRDADRHRPGRQRRPDDRHDRGAGQKTARLESAIRGRRDPDEPGSSPARRRTTRPRASTATA